MLEVFADGRVFGYRVGQHSPSVLGLAGWGQTGKDLLAALDSCSALALDLPGFGASPPPPQIVGTSGYAQLLTPVIERMETPITILGHSFGGRVALAFAAEHPDLIGRLVLTGVPVIRLEPPKKPKTRYRLFRWLHHRGWLDESKLERIRSRSGSADYRAAQGIMRSILVKVVNEDYRDILRGLQVPIDLVWGEEDQETPLAIAQEASQILNEEGIPQSLTVIEAGGHFLPQTHPEFFQQLLSEVPG